MKEQKKDSFWTVAELKEQFPSTRNHSRDNPSNSSKNEVVVVLDQVKKDERRSESPLD